MRCVISVGTLCSELSVQSRGEDGDRAAIPIVCGIDDELVVEGHATERHRETIVSLEYLLGTRMRKLSIPDKNTETAIVEKRFVLF